MTKSPVQVTLGEGNRHTAQFKDDDRVFDLSNDAEVRAEQNCYFKFIIVY